MNENLILAISKIRTEVTKAKAKYRANSDEQDAVVQTIINLREAEMWLATLPVTEPTTAKPADAKSKDKNDLDL
jgi:hypothetical protein